MKDLDELKLYIIILNNLTETKKEQKQLMDSFILKVEYLKRTE